MSAARRTAPYRSDATHRFRVNPVTLIAVTLFLAVLIAEAMFLTLNAPSVAGLGPLAAVAGSVP
jgi:hypothetical protein